jgi:hypothetical protein
MWISSVACGSRKCNVNCLPITPRASPTTIGNRLETRKRLKTDSSRSDRKRKILKKGKQKLRKTTCVNTGLLPHEKRIGKPLMWVASEQWSALITHPNWGLFL